MSGINFELEPAKQCATTDHGHFGEAYKEVYQGSSGLVAREVSYTPQQFSALQDYLMFRRDDGGHHSNDAGPYNPKYLDMAMHGDIYSLGETTRTLQKNYEPVPTGSKEYNEVVRNMEEARKNINFDSCNASTPKGLWVNLDKKD